MVFRANRDIEEDEELCDNYGPRYGVDLYADRQVGSIFQVSATSSTQIGWGLDSRKLIFI